MSSSVDTNVLGEWILVIKIKGYSLPETDFKMHK